MVKKAYVRSYKSQICKFLFQSSREIILSSTAKCCSLPRISYRVQVLKKKDVLARLLQSVSLIICFGVNNLRDIIQKLLE